jgi:hypothetical protein
MRAPTTVLLCLLSTLPSAYGVTLILGDTSGNARGTNSIDIQSSRSMADQVTSGSSSVTIGIDSTTSGNESVAFGLYNVTRGYYNVNLGSSNYTYPTTNESAVVGLGNEVTGAGGLAFGYCNVVFDNYDYTNNSGWYPSNSYSLAFGSFNSIESSSIRSYVFGRGNTATVANVGIFGADITNGITGSLMVGPSDTAKVTILSSGNVGIGTAAPTSKLHVVGDLNVTGTIINPGAATTGSGSTARLRVGGTTNPASSWQGTTVVGADGQNKIITGYLGSATNGAVIGAHNSALSGWADLNVAGSNLIFRTSETERMRISSNGSVGIGTSTPNGKLNVSGDGQHYTNFDSYVNTANYWERATVRFQRARGTQAAPTNVAAGDWLGDVAFTAWNNGFVHPSANLIAMVDGTPGATYAPAKLAFYTSDGASASQARMTIGANGNVGIGTSSPLSTLDVRTTAGTGATTELLRLTPGGGSNTSGTASRIAGYSDVLNGYIDFKRFSASGPQSGITFGTYGGDVLTVRSSGAGIPGNVGIGTTTPASKLTVLASGAIDSSASSDRDFYVTIAGPNRTVSSGTTSGQVGIFANDAALLTGAGGSLALGATYNTSGHLAINAVIQSGRDNSVNGNYGGYMSLFTRPHGGNATERIRIASDGKVGINTPFPSEQLHVAGNARVTGNMTVGGTTLTVNGYGVLTSGGGYGGNLIALNASSISDGTLSAARLPASAVQVDATQTLANKTLASANLTGTTTLGGSTAAQQVLVDASGNVGIGTSTPGAKLNVNGNAVVQGSITADSTISASELAASYITFGFGLSELYIESYAMPGSPEMWIHGGDALGLYASESISLMSNEVRVGLDANTGPAIKAAVTPGSAPQTYDNQDLVLAPSGNGRLVVASGTELAGDIKVKNRAVIRVSPAGDIPMIANPVGTNPEL